MSLWQVFALTSNCPIWLMAAAETIHQPSQLPPTCTSSRMALECQRATSALAPVVPDTGFHDSKWRRHALTPAELHLAAQRCSSPSDCTR